MQFLSTGTLIALLSSSVWQVLAADTKTPEKPCTIHSTSTGSFYDLSPLKLIPRDDDNPKSKGTNESYHARGYDYHRNFTINFCAPVVEEIRHVVDVPRSLWGNVSAYYRDSDNDIISIGQLNDQPIFRGRKLLLNYTRGSPCPDLDADGEPINEYSLSSKARDTGKVADHLWDYKIVGGDDDDDDDDEDDRKTHKPSKNPSTGKVVRRKSTLISFNCDTSPSLATRPSISFLGSPDHCTYIFEVRSRWACPGATSQTEKGELGPGGVFGVILGIAVAVYVIGGVVYQRSVMHQRGWRQLPNYGVWAGLFSFFKDMTIILFSSCTRCMPSLGRLFGGKQGYHRVGIESRANGSLGRGRSSEDANRLIDSLDEEWD